jgi:hypothetical protein
MENKSPCSSNTRKKHRDDHYGWRSTSLGDAIRWQP